MFGEILKEVRNSHKHSLRELGEKTGILFTYISKVENNLKSPPKDFVSKIIKVYPLEKNKLLKAYLTDLLPDNETIEIFKNEKNSLTDIHSFLFSKLTTKEKKEYLNNLVEKIEYMAYKQGKIEEDKKEIDMIRKYIEKL